MILTFDQILDENGKAAENREALVSDKQRVTYGALKKSVDEIANQLVTVGFKKNDRIAILFPNSVEFVTLLFAITKIGAVAVVLNTHFRHRELLHTLGTSGAAAIFAALQYENFNYGQWLETNRAALTDLKHTFMIEEPPIPPLDRVVYLPTPLTGTYCYRLSELPINQTHPKPDDPAIVIYTSGSTGAPKGAVLSYRNLVNNASRVSAIMEYSEQDTVLPVLPLFSSAGISVLLMTFLNCGKLVLLDSYSPETVLKIIEKEKVTILDMIPNSYNFLLTAPSFNKYDLSSVRLNTVGGDVCHPALMKRILERFKCNLSIVYGLTETSPVVSITRLRDTEENKTGTVGKAIPGVEVKVVDDDRRPLRIGECGELACRGDNVMMGYLNEPNETERLIDADGWFYTGDLATIDRDGYIRIVGRKKEMLCISGFNVSLKEIEMCLESHTLIKKAAVVGIGRGVSVMIIAFVVMNDEDTCTEKELLEYCRERIASYKVPHKIYFIEEIPLTGSTKMDKGALIKEYRRKAESREK